MNRNHKLAIALGFMAVMFAVLICSSAGAPACHLMGKAVWTAPYVSLVFALRCLARA